MGNYIVKATQMEESKKKDMEKFLKYKNEPYMKPVNLYRYKFIPNLKKIIE